MTDADKQSDDANPGTGPQARPLPFLNRAAMVLSCALLLSGSGVFGASSAQGDPVCENDAGLVCGAPSTTEIVDGTSCIVSQVVNDPILQSLFTPAGEPVAEVEAVAVPVLLGATNTLLAGDPEHAEQAIHAVPGRFAPKCCNLFIDSRADGTTRWTDAQSPGAQGYNRIPVDMGASSWINGARLIWKQNPSVGDGVPTDHGVVFTTAFVTCLCPQCNTGTLRVQSDDAQRVFFNDQLIGTCGTWGYPAACQATYTVTGIKPYPHENTIRIQVKNQAAPVTANVAYRLDW